MTYGLVAIVKNEAATIERCLESLRFVSAATIIDTGSTDGTQEIIARVMPKAKVLELPFVNFGHSRSEAFAAAQGTADWLIATDADMTWEIDADFEPDPSVDAYMIEMGGAERSPTNRRSVFSYRLPLLLNGARSWKSVGAVHEYTLLSDGTLGRREPTDKVRVIHHGEGRSTLEKTQWHAKLLEADLEREPDNPRTVFYLAQTYRELGDTANALRLYRQRAGMGGFAEEAFYAAYRGALIEVEWGDRMAALLAAWETRPSRLEPLHALVCELNQRDQHHAAYQLSLIPAHPTIDVLFVHKDVWAWGLVFERSIAAWWCGYRDEARLLGEELLTRDLPDHIRGAVLRNLAFTEPVAA